ncbi:hypothetical protein VTN02DRAFT_6750 [Thermoascus thermophilus]
MNVRGKNLYQACLVTIRPAGINSISFRVRSLVNLLLYYYGRFWLPSPQLHLRVLSIPSLTVLLLLLLLLLLLFCLS